MNLPIKLTVSRLFLTFIIVLLLLVPWNLLGVNMPIIIIEGITCNIKYFIAGVLFFFAVITDLLDGKIARHKNQVTNTGKILDSIADKVLVDSVLIILAYQGFISALVPVIIVIRDIFIDAISMEALSKEKTINQSKSSRIKSFSLYLGLLLMFFYNLPFELWNIHLDVFLIYFAMVMAVCSLIEYFNLNKEIIFSVKKTD